MQFVIGLVVISLMSSCAHRRADYFRATNDPSVNAEVLPAVESHRVTDPKPPKVEDPELAIENVPMEMNAHVQNWLDYFQGRGRPHMEVFLSRSTRYSDIMKRILRENGMPEDLIYVAMIESGFSSRATSHASAVGYWQFIRGTGLAYGLKIDGYVDERRDPVLATQAAANYFKSLHTLFDSWYLAMASYNVGENRVKRELMKHHTRDYWELVRLKRLPAETRSYVPKFLAAKLIGENPEKYGFTNINYAPPIEFDQITVGHNVDLKAFASNLGISYNEMQALNPKFRTTVAPTEGSQLELRIPPGQQALAMVAASKSIATARHIAESSDTTRYRVKRGDTLSGIAQRHRTSVARLRDLNKMSRRSVLRAGSRIYVPDTSVGRSSGSRELTADGRYRVKRGDNLYEIARSFGTSVDSLASLNGMTRKSVLMAGRYIRVKNDVEAAPTVQAVAKAVGETPTQVESHRVRRGENLTLIARKYGKSVPELQQLNDLRRGSMLHVGQRLKISGDVAASAIDITPVVHVVRRGENLGLIARKYGTSVNALQQLNGLSRRSLIQVGQRLIVSQGDEVAGDSARRVHIVRSGDTLSHLADRYRIPVAKIVSANDIARNSTIHVGSKLVIPE